MRNTTLSAVFAAGFLLTSASAMAQTDVTPTLPANTTYTYYSPTNPPSAPNGDDTIVCNYQVETGSHLMSRVCRTLRAWKMMQADAREYMGFDFRGTHQSQTPSGKPGGG